MSPASYLWWTKSKTANALLAFEIAVVLQIVSDGFAQSILAGFRGLPIPAGVFGVACATPLCGQSYVYNAMLSVTTAILYYIAQAHWHPEIVQPIAQTDSARAFFAYIVVGCVRRVPVCVLVCATRGVCPFRLHSSSTSTRSFDGSPIAHALWCLLWRWWRLVVDCTTHLHPPPEPPCMHATTRTVPQADNTPRQTRYLSDKSMRTQSHARYNLRLFKSDLDKSVQGGLCAGRRDGISNDESRRLPTMESQHRPNNNGVSRLAPMLNYAAHRGLGRTTGTRSNSRNNNSRRRHSTARAAAAIAAGGDGGDGDQRALRLHGNDGSRHHQDGRRDGHIGGGAREGGAGEARTFAVLHANHEEDAEETKFSVSSSASSSSSSSVAASSSFSPMVPLVPPRKTHRRRPSVQQFLDQDTVKFMYVHACDGKIEIWSGVGE